MISPDLLDKLNAEIENELFAISNDIGANHAMKLIELTKCVDHCFVAVSYIMPKDSTDYQEWADLFQQFSTGWYVALKMVLPENEGTISIMKVNSRPEQISWANSIMTRSGDAGNIKKLLALAKSSDFINTCLKEPNTVLFHFKGTDIGIEYLETQQQKWLAESILNQREPVDDFENVIMPQVKSGVSSPDGKTISYQPHTVIDSFFQAEGRFYGEALICFDSFIDQSLFNNIPFIQYKEVVTCLIGNAFRHLHYCLAFQDKTGYRVINPWNTYTQVVNVDEVREMVCRQTGLPEETVNSILQTIILDRESLELTGFAPGSSPPPLIRLNNSKVVISMMGHLSNPLSYLFRILVKKFNDDYSVAVNDREEIFKRELYDLFDKSLLSIPHNIAIRKGGKLVTDIDALIIDEASGIAFLFQLKWMDDWGSDMSQRSSMSKNYRMSIEKWLNAVDKHIAEKGAAVFLRDAGVTKNGHKVTIVKIVLGRHFSLFSNLSLPEDSFYLNWATLVKIVSENPQCGISLKKLIDHLSKNKLAKNLKASPLPIKDVMLRLGKYIIKTKS